MAVALVLRAHGLGDLLTAVPALRALRRAYPRHRVVLATPGPLAPLALHTRAVDAVIPARLPASLPTAVNGAEVAVNLHDRGPAGHRVLLERRPRRLIAFAHPEVSESSTGPEWKADEQEAERWCRLLRESGIDADPADLRIAPPDGVVVRDELTVIHTGAASAERRWAPARWAAVAAVERRRGRRVVLTGSSEERPLCRRIAAAAGLPPASVMAGSTGVMELAWVVASAGRVASAETGVAHLAVALGRPSLVLAGPSAPRGLRAPAAGGDLRILRPSASAASPEDGMSRGLDAIGVDEVTAALADLGGFRRRRHPAAARRHARPPGGAAGSARG
jgi:ADP-heptose:LPS heptosyltransferase